MKNIVDYPEKLYKEKANFPKKLFITGTDTNVGKTFISALFLLGKNAGYFKPIQTGLEKDTQTLQNLTNLPPSHFYKESYHFINPLSPHLAAEREKKKIDLNNIILPSFTQENLIIEGAGGVFVPINENTLIIDLIVKCSCPALIVARNCLGTINHTLLTIMALKKKNIPIWGVILNGERNADNKSAIEKHGGIQVLAEIPLQKSITKTSLITLYQKHFSL